MKSIEVEGDNIVFESIFDSLIQLCVLFYCIPILFILMLLLLQLKVVKHDF